MSVQANQDRVRSRIWQAIAQSGVDLAPIPREQVSLLVDHVTSSVLTELDALLDEVAAPAPAAQTRTAEAGLIAAPVADASAQEQILWEGRPFLSLVERYIVTNQRVRIITGLVGRANEDIEMIRVKDVDHSQGISERLLNIGDVYLHSVDASRPDAVLRNVKDPQQVHEIIRQGMLEARKKYPYIFAQEL